jgi:hypothetical protein
MPIEKAPRNPVPRNWPTSRPYRVKGGDTWETIARANGLGVWDLIEANFKTRDPAEVNWYLHHYVGCTQTTADGRNYVFSSAAKPGLIYIPPGGRIRLSVPMREQRQNPICWIACVAMISSYKGRTSVGIGSFTGGFDPSSSSIPNPTMSWADQYRRLSTFGFVSENPFPNRSPDAAYIADLLRSHGPWMLTHLASDLLPGNFSPNDTHAVVITGIDTSTGQVWYNNPWGRVDEVTTVNQILLAMQNLLSRGIHAVAYIP